MLRHPLTSRCVSTHCHECTEQEKCSLSSPAPSCVHQKAATGRQDTDKNTLNGHEKWHIMYFRQAASVTVCGCEECREAQTERVVCCQRHIDRILPVGQVSTDWPRQILNCSKQRMRGGDAPAKVTRFCTRSPIWSPRAPLMAAVSADSLEDRAPLAFSSLSNHPTSCSGTCVPLIDFTHHTHTLRTCKASWSHATGLKRSRSMS